MKYNTLHPTGIIIHCAATKASMDVGAKEIEKWHRQRGFFSIGYHYVIRRDGTVEKGRPDNIPGAHARGHNHYTLAVCMVGGIDDKGKPEDNFTDAQWGSLAELVATLLRDNTKLEFVIGHRDLPDVAKACPCFDTMEWVESHTLLINLLERNHVQD